MKPATIVSDTTHEERARLCQFRARSSRGPKSTLLEEARVLGVKIR
jgi:hypothetical protein